MRPLDVALRGSATSSGQMERRDPSILDWGGGDVLQDCNPLLTQKNADVITLCVMF